jgi:hypothetical protein
MESTVKIFEWICDKQSTTVEVLNNIYVMKSLYDFLKVYTKHLMERGNMCDLVTTI